MVVCRVAGADASMPGRLVSTRNARRLLPVDRTRPDRAGGATVARRPVSAVRLLGRHHRTVVVAVVAVWVVKMAGDAIIYVVAVRHRVVATAGAVYMAALMPAAAVVGGAAVGILA